MTADSETERETMNKKAAQRLASNRRILDSALTEFSEKGYARALLGNIAKEAGVSNGMITQRFSGKENLYNSVFVDLISTYLEKMERESGSLNHMLRYIVKSIKSGATKKTREFRFIYDLLVSRDSPVNSFDQIRELFEKTAVCSKMLEEMDAGRITRGDPFELIRSFLIASFEATKVFNDASLTLPDSEAYLTLLRPRERRKNSDMDRMKARLLDELVGQISSEYEVILMINLENSLSFVGRKSGLFLELDSPMSEGSIDEYTLHFANEVVHPDYRESFIEFFKVERLLRLFEPGKSLTISFRTVYPQRPFYQATVVFNQVDTDGHWITLTIKDTDRVLQDEIRSAVVAAERRMSAFFAKIADMYDLVVFFDMEEDVTHIYKMQGEFDLLSDRIRENMSVRSFTDSLTARVCPDKDRDDLRDSIRKAIENLTSSDDKIQFLAFDAVIQGKSSRCIIEIASVSEDNRDIIFVMSDSEKSLVRINTHK